ncbi:Protein Thf1 [Sesbania bispinosa]|nr:Protein Thf1 [Sesbania bispinosa]
MTNYRIDAQRLEEWARAQNSSSLVEFSSKEGEVEGGLKGYCRKSRRKGKRSVDRDLDVYRNLLSKLVQAKELLKEYVDREKKKREERAEPQKANEAITTCLGQQLSGL